MRQEVRVSSWTAPTDIPNPKHEDMRSINLIVIHCSAVRPDQTSSARQIDQWHRQMHYKCIGYHYVIRRNGVVEQGRPVCDVGAHCGRIFNAHSIGICYEGGLDINGQPADTRTEAQKLSMLNLLKSLANKYPDSIIVGHRDLPGVHKACPCFDVGEWLDDVDFCI